MPAGDRTGPWGLGPRTGRALGYCSGFQAPGFMYPGPGLGFGRGFGFSRGFGRGMRFGRGRGFWRPRFFGYWDYPYYPMTPPPPSRKDEAAWLADQAKILEQQLAEIRQRLGKLENAKETGS